MHQPRRDHVRNRHLYPVRLHTLQYDTHTGTCDKLPMLILVQILQRLPHTPEGDTIAKAICGGAYSIGMTRVCMNVFVRREQVSAGKFAIKKFSLCYPADINKTQGDAKYNHKWKLLDGVSWRTAVFKGDTLGDARRMLEIFDTLVTTPALLKVMEVDHYEDAVGCGARCGGEDTCGECCGGDWVGVVL